MKEQETQSQLVANFSEMISIVNLFLSDFKKVFGNEEIKNTLPAVEGVYMYVIVMYLGKIFSKSPNEHFSLNKFSNHFPQMEYRIEQIYKNHKDIIGKVKNNRDQLFAHTDKNFYKLGFSQVHIDKLKKIYDTDFSRIKAISKEQERYTPADLNADLIEIGQIMSTVDKLWKDTLMLIDFEK